MGYRFWAHAPDCCYDVLDDIAEAAQHVTTLPTALHLSKTASIPKAELLAEPGDARPASDTLRPLTMITTGEKLIALRINNIIAPVAARTVTPPQHGFVVDRKMSEDIVGLDGAMPGTSA